MGELVAVGVEVDCPSGLLEGGVGGVWREEVQGEGEVSVRDGEGW